MHMYTPYAHCKHTHTSEHAHDLTIFFLTRQHLANQSIRHACKSLPDTIHTHTHTRTIRLLAYIWRRDRKRENESNFFVSSFNRERDFFGGAFRIFAFPREREFNFAKLSLPRCR